MGASRNPKLTALPQYEAGALRHLLRLLLGLFLLRHDFGFLECVLIRRQVSSS
jgi:hypothetical protein